MKLITKTALVIILLVIIGFVPKNLFNIGTEIGYYKLLIVFVISVAFIVHDRLGIKNLFNYRPIVKNYYLLPLVIITIQYGLLHYSTFKDLVYLRIPMPILIYTLFYVFNEELLFRGYLLRMYLRNINCYKSIIISSGVFALIHLINCFKGMSVFSAFNQLILAFFFGVLAGSIFIITRSILIPTLIHFLYNLPAEYEKFKIIDQQSYIENMLDSSMINLVIGSILFIFVHTPLILVGIYYLNIVKELYRK